MEFQNRIALVTGGSSGIGRAISLQLADAGATVLMVARDRAKGEIARRLIADRGGRSEFYSVELGNEAAVRELMQEVDRTYGELHIVINCAGGGESRMSAEERVNVTARWKGMSDMNFFSAYLVSAYGVEIMCRTGGAIVNISSTASIHGNYGLYGAMKAGLEGLTRSMAMEYAPYSIRVNAIAPGWIRTAGTLPNADDPAQAAWAQTASVLGRMGEVEEVADAALFLASERASFITGVTLFVDGGLSIIDPTAASWAEAVGRGKGI